jgi:hypothetical protein
MSRLLNELLSYILTESTSKPPADKPPYSTGKKWGAVRNGKRDYFDSEAEAEAWYNQGGKEKATAQKKPERGQRKTAAVSSKPTKTASEPTKPSSTTTPKIKALVDSGATIEELTKLAMPSEMFKDIDTEEVKVADILGENYSELILSKDDIRNKRDQFFEQQGIEEKISAYSQKKIEALRANGIAVDEKKEKQKIRRELALSVEAFYKKRNYNIRLFERIQRGY